MLTIRQNIFETNSSSTHCFAFNLADDISKEQQEKNADTLHYHIKAKGTILIIDGISDEVMCREECYFTNVYEKMQLVANEIIANEDSGLEEIFNDVIKEQFPQIKQIEYNIVFAGRNRNTVYNPTAINTDCIFSDNEDYLDYSKKTLYEMFVTDPKTLKLFLFGNSELRREEFST